jgi:hypothetical protein
MSKVHEPIDDCRKRGLVWRRQPMGLPNRDFQLRRDRVSQNAYASLISRGPGLALPRTTGNHHPAKALDARPIWARNPGIVLADSTQFPSCAVSSALVMVGLWESPGRTLRGRSAPTKLQQDETAQHEKRASHHGVYPFSLT